MKVPIDPRDEADCRSQKLYVIKLETEVVPEKIKNTVDAKDFDIENIFNKLK